MTKRKFNRSWLMLALAAVLLSASAIAFLFGRATASQILPNPNGYDDLIKATRTIVATADNQSELDHDALGALVATNAEALRLLRVGLARRCAISTDDEIKNFSTLSVDLMGLKSLAKLLSAEGRLAEMEDRPVDAAQSYVDTIHLGSQMSHGGFIINRLVGIACEGMGSLRLTKLLPKLICEQIRPLVAELEQIDANAVPWREIRQNENRFVYAEMRKHPNPIQWVNEWWQSRDVNRAAEGRHDLAEAHLRLLMVELALRCYICDRGKGPDNLEQLVPKYLKRLPADPFSGNPLVYHPAGTNWMLYSLGPDRVDDGGKPMGRPTSDDYLIGFGPSGSDKAKMKGDLLYDSAW